MNCHIHPPHDPENRKQHGPLEQHIIRRAHHPQRWEQRIHQRAEFGIFHVLFLFCLGQLLIIELVLHRAKTAAAHGILGDHFRHLVPFPAIKPGFQGSHGIAVEILHMQLFHDPLDPAFVHVRMGIAEYIQIHKMPHTNAADSEMLGHMAENVGKLHFQRHCPLMSLLQPRLFPAYTKIFAQQGLGGRIQTFMQLQIQLRTLPNMIINGLFGIFILQLCHQGLDFFVLLHPNQHVCIAHATHLRFGIALFHVAALQQHIIDAVFFKGRTELLYRRKLPLTNDQMAEILHLVILHPLGFGINPTVQRTGIDQRNQRLLADQSVCSFQGKTLRQFQLLTCQRTLDQRKQALINRVHRMPPTGDYFLKSRFSVRFP